MHYPIPTRQNFRPDQTDGVEMFYPFPNWQILDSSKLDEFADDNFEFNENGDKFSKKVGNTVGKAEIPTVFSKDLFCRHIKTRACLGKG